jgi:hypothetical protein
MVGGVNLAICSGISGTKRRRCRDIGEDTLLTITVSPCHNVLARWSFSVSEFEARSPTLRLASGHVSDRLAGAVQSTENGAPVTMNVLVMAWPLKKILGCPECIVKETS